MAILDTFDSAICTLESAADAQPKKVQVCQRTVMPKLSEASVRIKASNSGLPLIIRHEGSVRKQSILCADGLMEVILDKPFTLMVSNITNVRSRLQKNLTIAWAEPHPDYYIPLENLYSQARH